uniref:Uncharacterized protein n=1 Tax=Mus musculus TaxID=10090 RepID=Q3V3R9_MOUSE|nr:unnamed protein product [Mus musculus]
MSLLDCFCASRTRVESLRPEKQSETSIHQYLVRKWLTPDRASPLPSVTLFADSSLPCWSPWICN